MRVYFEKKLSLSLVVFLLIGSIPVKVYANDEYNATDKSSEPLFTMDISNITDSTAHLTITSNQDGTIYYFVQKAAEVKPVDFTNNEAIVSVNVTAFTPWTTVLESLSSDTEYIIYALIMTNENISETLSHSFVTLDNEGKAPKVSFISAIITTDGANLTFESNQSGTYYGLIKETNTDEPDSLTVKDLGNAYGGSGQVATGSAITVFVNAELDENDQYTAYLVVENESGILSEVESLPLTNEDMLTYMATGTPDISWYTTKPSAEVYEISNADQLAGMSLLLSNSSPVDVKGFAGKILRLTNDIDLSPYQAGTGWTPIGKYDIFTGTFDGNGKTITGLKISGVTSGAQGLFGKMDGTVKNLMLKDVSITANTDDVGGIAGRIANGGIIDSCYVSGTISAEGRWSIGGIVGTLYVGTVKNCVSTANVTGDKQVGGIAGHVGGLIKDCYATGIITAGTGYLCNAGGIGGYAIKNSSYNGSIRNCAALNTSVTGMSGGANRILGGTGGEQADSIVLSGNYGSSSMLINNTQVSGGNANDLNGEPKSEADWLRASTWGSEGLNFSTEVWNIQDGRLPIQQVFDEAPSISVINIYTHPVPITNVTVGNISATLTVEASVSPEGSLTYQWYSNTTESNVGGTPILGATTSSFSVPTELMPGTYYYFCEVSASGASSVRSNVARVNVSAAPDKTGPVPGESGKLYIQSYNAIIPKITLTWTKATDDVSNQSELKYYIYRSDSDNIHTAQECETNGVLQNVGGSKNIDSFSPGWPDYTNAYYYNVVVEDGAGNKAAYIPVLRNGIDIAKQPQNLTLAKGYISGSLSVSASSTPEETVSYQWYYNSIDTYGSDSKELTGETGDSFKIPDTLALGIHYYYCKVSIKGGSIWAYTNRVKVSVLSTPVAPTITGKTEMKLTEGYLDTSSDPFSINGTYPVTVVKKAGHEKITWDNDQKRLNIAAGLTEGVYPVTLEASHPSGLTSTLTFTLTVEAMVNSISIEKEPDKTVFKDGDRLDLTGLQVKVLMKDGTTEYVSFEDFTSKGITTVPDNGSILTSGTSKVTIKLGSKTVEFGIKVKMLQGPPAKPQLATKTAESVTLKTMEGAKYRIGTDGAWQDSPTFTGLIPNTTYTFYAIYPETETHFESNVSEGLIVTTEKAILSGEVTIEGSANYGETLTVQLGGLIVMPVGAEKGTLSFGWMDSVSGDLLGTESTYTLTEEDIGRKITVTVSADNCNGSVTSLPVTVEKAEGQSITAINGSLSGDGVTFTYKIDPVINAEYSMDGVSWQDSNEFTGFTTDSPPTTFYARIKETKTHKAGPYVSTEPVSFTKLENPQIPTLEYTVSGSSNNRIINIKPVDKAEYKFGDEPWSDESSKGGYAKGEIVTIQIRYKETGTHKPSLANSTTVLTAKENQDAPQAFKLTYTYDQITGLYTVTIPEIPGGEYSFDGTVFDQIRTKDVAPGSTVTGGSI